LSDKKFLTISEAVKATGLSGYFLRTGVRAGTVPHIKNGNRYLINVSALLELLDKQSKEVTRE